MAVGTIFDIQRYSIHDGPGIRTTVFLKGCPLSCKWCHNPEGQSPEPELLFRENRCGLCGACVAVCKRGAISWSGSRTPGAVAADGHARRDNRHASRGGDHSDLGETTGPGVPVTDRKKCAACGDCVAVCFSGARELAGKRMSVEQVVSELRRDAPFYEESGGGVTLSGGEPLAQPEFTAELLKACKRAGMHTAVDTCGFAPWTTVDLVREHVDLFLYDLKLLDDVRHRELVGVSNAGIIKNLRELATRGHEIVLRLPIIPGVNEDDESIIQIGRFASALPGLIRVDVLPYHRIGADKYTRLGRPYSLSGLEPPAPDRMAEIARMLESRGLCVNRRA